MITMPMYAEKDLRAERPTTGSGRMVVLGRFEKAGEANQIRVS